MALKCLIVFDLLTIVCILPCRTGASTDGYNLVLQHDLGNGFFAQRGIIHFPTIKGEDAEIMGQRELNNTELQLLNDLKNSDGIYKIRVGGQLMTSDALEGENFVMAYTDARSLIASGLRDTITILTDELGNIISIEVKPQQNVKVYDDELENFSTILIINSIGPGPVPDTAGFLNKLKEEKMKKEKAEKDPKSFFGKYWMYILPVVFIMMMSNANQQQQQ